jgi:ABC-type sugar transport system substrate-binding protein
MKKLFILIAVVVFCLFTVTTFTAAQEYKFVFLCHGGEENPAWGLIYRGMKDAADSLGVSAIMYRPTTEGDLAQQLANFKTGLAQRPDGIITSIPHPTMFNSVINQALDRGIPVIVSNTNACKRGLQVFPLTIQGTYTGGHRRARTFLGRTEILRNNHLFKGGRIHKLRKA